VAGRFTFSWLGDDQLAFSFLNRYESRLQFEARRIDTRDAGMTEPSDFTGEVLPLDRLNETWWGLSWATPLGGGNAAVGLTWYGAFRTDRERFQTTAVAVAPDGSEGSAALLVRDVKYWNVRTLAKVGIAFDYSPLLFGVSVTTPSLNMFGQGAVFEEVALINVDPGMTGTNQSLLASNYQEELASECKSPLSIAGGASYRFGDIELHGTVEWFDAVSSYEVLSPEPYTAQTTDSVITPAVEESARSVTNVGIGVAYDVTDRVALYGGFTTDRSARTPSSETTSVGFNIYHFTVGSRFYVRSLGFTLGVNYSRGQEDVAQLIDFDPGSEGLFPDTGTTRFNYQRLKFIVGFEFPL